MGFKTKDLNNSGVLRQGSVEIQHVGVWTFGGQILEVGLRAGDSLGSHSDDRWTLADN